MTFAALVLAAIAAVTSAEARRARRSSSSILDSYSVPNPILTPGNVNPAATVDVICNATTKERRNITLATRAKVLRTAISRQ